MVYFSSTALLGESVGKTVARQKFGNLLFGEEPVLCEHVNLSTLAGFFSE